MYTSNKQKTLSATVSCGSLNHYSNSKSKPGHLNCGVLLFFGFCTRCLVTNANRRWKRLFAIFPPSTTVLCTSKNNDYVTLQSKAWMRRYRVCIPTSLPSSSSNLSLISRILAKRSRIASCYLSSSYSSTFSFHTRHKRSRINTCNLAIG